MRCMYVLTFRLFAVFFSVLVMGSVAEAQTHFPAVNMKLAYPELTVQRPVWLCEAPDGSGRIFLVEQNGRIRILPKDRNGKEAAVFLDITDRKPYASNE